MRTTNIESPAVALARAVLKEFEKKSGLSGISHEIKERPNGAALIVDVLRPTERLYAVLSEALAAAGQSESVTITGTIRKVSDSAPLKRPETRLLLKTIAESLTINRHSLNERFFSQYSRSLFGAEEQIVSASNHVVYGRRGSGKSSLLLYALHGREDAGQPSVWVDMQVYAGRGDLAVVADILYEITEQAWDLLSDRPHAHAVRDQLQRLKNYGEAVTDLNLRQALPDLKRLFSKPASGSSDLFVFLDDFHVLKPELQPQLLDVLYSFTRGNRVFLKLSAIETFTRLFDASRRVGLETPHDAQLVKLDYNLTITAKATEHIKQILDNHAEYCGIPSARVLCLDNDVLNRLVWVAAGVPRDALSVFSQSITKADLGGQRRITVTNINVSSAEMISDKRRDIELDTSGSFDAANDLLSEIRDFCLKEKKTNAFVVEMIHDDLTYRLVRQLVDLRLLHVIQEGMTRHHADRKYVALILDYGFYIGVRAAKSIDLFNKQVGTPTFAELRGLPVFIRSSHATSPPGDTPGTTVGKAKIVKG